MKTNNLIVDTLLEAQFDILQIKEALEDGQYIKDENLTQDEVEEAYGVVCSIIKNSNLY